MNISRIYLLFTVDNVRLLLESLIFGWKKSLERKLNILARINKVK